MKLIDRRKLMKSSVAAVAASATLLAKAESARSIAAGPFTVHAGDGRPGGQWLIHGDKAFSTKVSGADVGRMYAAIEVHTPPDRGPELHIHPDQNELFFMLKGSIGVQCGSERMILKSGDTFMAPANVPHAYVTLGPEPAHMLLIYDPAGDMEGFFAEYAPVISVEGEPDQRKLAEVYVKHGLKVAGAPTSSFKLFGLDQR